MYIEFKSSHVRVNVSPCNPIRLISFFEENPILFREISSLFLLLSTSISFPSSLFNIDIY